MAWLRAKRMELECDVRRIAARVACSSRDNGDATTPGALRTGEHGDRAASPLSSLLSAEGESVGLASRCGAGADVAAPTPCFELSFADAQDGASGAARSDTALTCCAAHGRFALLRCSGRYRQATTAGDDADAEDEAADASSLALVKIDTTDHVEPVQLLARVATLPVPSMRHRERCFYQCRQRGHEVKEDADDEENDHDEDEEEEDDNNNNRQRHRQQQRRRRGQRRFQRSTQTRNSESENAGSSCNSAGVRDVIGALCPVRAESSSDADDGDDSAVSDDADRDDRCVIVATLQTYAVDHVAEQCDTADATRLDRRSPLHREASATHDHCRGAAATVAACQVSVVRSVSPGAWTSAPLARFRVDADDDRGAMRTVSSSRASGEHGDGDKRDYDNTQTTTIRDSHDAVAGARRCAPHVAVACEHDRVLYVFVTLYGALTVQRIEFNASLAAEATSAGTTSNIAQCADMRQLAYGRLNVLGDTKEDADGRAQARARAEVDDDSDAPLLVHRLNRHRDGTARFVVVYGRSIVVVRHGAHTDGDDDNGGARHDVDTSSNVRAVLRASLDDVGNEADARRREALRLMLCTRESIAVVDTRSVHGGADRARVAGVPSAAVVPVPVCTFARCDVRVATQSFVAGVAHSRRSMRDDDDDDDDDDDGDADEEDAGQKEERKEHGRKASDNEDGGENDTNGDSRDSSRPPIATSPATIATLVVHATHNLQSRRAISILARPRAVARENACAVTLHAGHRFVIVQCRDGDEAVRRRCRRGVRARSRGQLRGDHKAGHATPPLDESDASARFANGRSAFLVPVS